MKSTFTPGGYSLDSGVQTLRFLEFGLSFERANERANDQTYSYVEIKDFQSHLVIHTGFSKLVG